MAKKMTFGAVMARGNYFPFIELIGGEWAKIEGYGANDNGTFWLQVAIYNCGGYGNVASYKRYDSIDASTELTVVSVD